MAGLKASQRSQKPGNMAIAIPAVTLFMGFPAFAQVIEFTPLFDPPTAIPALHGIALVMLGLLLAATAFRMLRKKGFSDRGAAISTLTLGSLAASISGVQLISHSSAVLVVTEHILANPVQQEFVLEHNQLYINNSGVDMDITKYQPLDCVPEVNSLENRDATSTCRLGLVVPRNQSCMVGRDLCAPCQEAGGCGPSIAPMADANGPYTVREGHTITLDASGSSDPDQPASSLLFEWDYDGDSQYDDAVGMKPVFSAASLVGPTTVTLGLKVTDAEGASDTDTTSVQVLHACGADNNFGQLFQEDTPGGVRQAVYREFTVPPGRDAAIAIVANYTVSLDLDVTVLVDVNGDGVDETIHIDEDEAKPDDTPDTPWVVEGELQEVLTEVGPDASSNEQISTAIFIVPILGSDQSRLAKVRIQGGITTDIIATAGSYNCVNQTDPVGSTATNLKSVIDDESILIVPDVEPENLTLDGLIARERDSQEATLVADILSLDPQQNQAVVLNASHTAAGTRATITGVASTDDRDDAPSAGNSVFAWDMNPLGVAGFAHAAVEIQYHEGGSIGDTAPPSADANGPYTVAEGGSVTLDASGSSDPDQITPSLLFEWDFDGDNQYDDAVGIEPLFSAASLVGPTTVTLGLKVTDVYGKTDTDTAIVQVKDAVAADSNFGQLFQESAPGDVLQSVYREFPVPPGKDSAIAIVANYTVTSDLDVTVLVDTSGDGVDETILIDESEAQPDDILATPWVIEGELESVLTDVGADASSNERITTAIFIVPISGSNQSRPAKVRIDGGITTDIIATTGSFDCVDQTDPVGSTATNLKSVIDNDSILVVPSVEHQNLTLDGLIARERDSRVATLTPDIFSLDPQQNQVGVLNARHTAAGTGATIIGVASTDDRDDSPSSGNSVLAWYMNPLGVAGFAHAAVEIRSCDN